MAFYRERGLKDFANEVTGDGVGIGGGFVIGGMIGRQVEDLLYNPTTNPVDQNSPILKKLAAWGANNGAKAVLYILAKHYAIDHPVARKGSEALAGSVVYDTLLRIANHGYNPAQVTLSGYRILGTEASSPVKVQQLLSENQLLRTELNKALQRLAGTNAPQIPQTNSLPGYNPDSSGDFKNAAVPDPYERQKRYGAMALPSIQSTPTAPAVSERNRKYGAMPFEQQTPANARQKKWGFALSQTEIASSNMFGML